MYKFKRLLVGLDQSEMDKTLINAAAEYASFGTVDDIYFVTVVKSLQVPETIKKEYSNLILPMDEKIEQKMHDEIQEAFANSSYDFHFDVLEGDITKQVIHWAKVKEIDLIILGNKGRHGGGLVSRNIVNIVHCSTLFVTAGSTIIPKSILVPIDFSKASHIAIQKADEIAHKVNASLTSLHIYAVPTGFHSTGKTFEEFAEIMLQHSQEDFKEFIDQESLSVAESKAEYLLDEHDEPYNLIAEFAITNKFDLVVIGSRGRTALSSVLLGSVAARLVGTDFTVPILVVKSKDDNMGLIDAILQI
jgi:nucleotide-binding universal stress UspA family protein